MTAVIVSSDLAQEHHCIFTDKVQPDFCTFKKLVQASWKVFASDCYVRLQNNKVYSRVERNTHSRYKYLTDSASLTHPFVHHGPGKIGPISVECLSLLFLKLSHHLFGLALTTCSSNHHLFLNVSPVILIYSFSSYGGQTS